MPANNVLFVNTHPAEIDDLELLIFSLGELRNLEPNRHLVLEIHEGAVTCGAQMRTLRTQLNEMKIGLAYDDFGAGQARLVELVDVPPDYLKFDMSLVQNLESASIERQRMLASLVQMVHDLGIAPLAEGIELAGDHEICRQIGFQFGQGFFYGYPVLPKQLLKAESISASDSSDAAQNGAL
jgi:EAL domain-containing protein (putative c-di-GMP-specific phosphodiesterase class I)